MSQPISGSWDFIRSAHFPRPHRQAQVAEGLVQVAALVVEGQEGDDSSFFHYIIMNE
jgi:hypothetical protein